jgi:hypothetical protein
MIINVDDEIKDRKDQNFLQSAITESTGFFNVSAGKTGLRRTRSKQHEIQYCERN